MPLLQHRPLPEAHDERRHSCGLSPKGSHGKRVITALFKDDAQLFKQFQDNESFRHWLTDTVFGMTYEK